MAVGGARMPVSGGLGVEERGSGRELLLRSSSVDVSVDVNKGLLRGTTGRRSLPGRRNQPLLKPARVRSAL